MADNCVEEVVKSVFCTTRVDPCTCPKANKYKSCVEGAGGALDKLKDIKMPDLPDNEFGVGKYLQKKKTKYVFRAMEAHHIVSCAGVKDEIQAKAAIADIVKATSYCINDAGNMLALPKFEHTISWYAHLSTGTLREGADLVAPPFADLAQHCRDHGPYLKEIRAACKRVAADVVEVAQEHAEDPTQPAPSLAAGINGLIADFKPWLVGKNTHNAWLKGIKKPNGDWYVAFSMVPAADAKRICFPSAGGTLGRKLKELARLFKKLG